jgi:hypothetical protein
MPPKLNKRKLDSNEEENQDANKKVHLDVTSNSSTGSGNAMAVQFGVVGNEGELDVAMAIDESKPVVSAANLPGGALDGGDGGDGDGVLDLRPTYRQTIQDEVHRMKGMDYSTALVQAAVWLPCEVMLMIMLSLSRTTVAIMTRVCKVRQTLVRLFVCLSVLFVCLSVCLSCLSVRCFAFRRFSHSGVEPAWQAQGAELVGPLSRPLAQLLRHTLLLLSDGRIAHCAASGIHVR